MSIDFNTVKLSQGEVQQYRIGAVSVHAYICNDQLNDTVILLEKAGHGVVIDPPSFLVTISELTEYIAMLGIKVNDVVLDYHMVGAVFLPKARKWSTKHAQEFALNGAGATMVQQFSAAFGDAFASELHTISDYITCNCLGEVELAGIKLKIKQSADAFDIEIPEINCVYVHMLGHDSHSVILSLQQAEELIVQLQVFIAKGISLILSAHHAPETVQDAVVKTKYLQKLIDLAKLAKTGEEFKGHMLATFPNYGGEHYLDMTVGALFSG